MLEIKESTTVKVTNVEEAIKFLDGLRKRYLPFFDSPNSRYDHSVFIYYQHSFNEGIKGNLNVFMDISYDEAKVDPSIKFPPFFFNIECNTFNPALPLFIDIRALLEPLPGIWRGAKGVSTGGQVRIKSVAQFNQVVKIIRELIKIGSKQPRKERNKSRL